MDHTNVQGGAGCPQGALKINHFLFSQGWAGVRERQICIMIHRSFLFKALVNVKAVKEGNEITDNEAISYLDLKQLYHRVFRRVCGFHYTDYMTVVDSEIEAEKEWAKNRKSVRERHEMYPELVNDQSGWACLSESEVTRAEDARVNLTEEDAVDLGQNFEHRKLCTRRGQLHTLIKGAGLTYMYAAKRWLTASELWTAQGFPVTDDCVETSGVQCQFSRCCADKAPSTRTRRSQINQIGNTMHVNAMGSLMMMVLIQSPVKDWPKAIDTEQDHHHKVSKRSDPDSSTIFATCFKMVLKRRKSETSET